MIEDCKGNREITKINSGVPQGSVLRPLLWNILYSDGVSEEVTLLFAFADNLTIMAMSKTENELERIANRQIISDDRKNGRIQCSVISNRRNT